MAAVTGTSQRTRRGGSSTASRGGPTTTTARSTTQRRRGRSRTPPNKATLNKTDDSDTDLPAELRMFAHAQFEPEDYVRGYCRDATSAAQIRRQLQKLRALELVAHEQLLRGAQDQAETYVAATTRVRETGATLAAACAHARAFEAALDDLDDALARAAGDTDLKTRPPPSSSSLSGPVVVEGGGQVVPVEREEATRREETRDPDRQQQNEAPVLLSPAETPPKKEEEEKPVVTSAPGVASSRAANKAREASPARAIPERETAPPKKSRAELSDETTTPADAAKEEARERVRRAGPKTPRAADAKKKTKTKTKSPPSPAMTLDARLAEIDGVMGDRPAAATAAWLRASRETRKQRRKQQQKDAEKDEPLESRRAALARLVKEADLSGSDAELTRRLFGFGSTARDAAAAHVNDFDDRDQKTLLVPPEGLFKTTADASTEELERARDAMCYALGDSRKALERRATSYAKAVKRATKRDAKTYRKNASQRWDRAWAFLAFVVDDLWRLFGPEKQSDSSDHVSSSSSTTAQRAAADKARRKKADKLSGLLQDLCDALVRDSVDATAPDFLDDDGKALEKDNRDPDRVLAAARRLAAACAGMSQATSTRESNKSHYNLDAFDTLDLHAHRPGGLAPPTLAARRLLVAALAPKIAKALAEVTARAGGDHLPAAQIRTALADLPPGTVSGAEPDPTLAAAVLRLDGRLDDLHRQL